MGWGKMVPVVMSDVYAVIPDPAEKLMPHGCLGRQQLGSQIVLGRVVHLEDDAMIWIFGVPSTDVKEEWTSRNPVLVKNPKVVQT